MINEDRERDCNAMDEYFPGEELLEMARSFNYEEAKEYLLKLIENFPQVNLYIDCPTCGMYMTVDTQISTYFYCCEGRPCHTCREEAILKKAAKINIKKEE